MAKHFSFRRFLTKGKRKILSHPRLSRTLLIIFSLVLVTFVIYLLAPSILVLGRKVILSQPVWSLRNDGGRTNVLLLGVGGTQHEGPNLTDTMIVVSAVTKFGRNDASVPPIYLVSIPRDIYINSIDSKINRAYELAGLPLAKEVTSQVTGLPIHYAIKIDFSVFEKIIDILGGIDINAPNILDDYSYPAAGEENNTCGLSPSEVTARAAAIIDDASAIAAFPCRYEHLHFDAGWQHMDGAAALKFVRSRHAEGDEGSDFARSRRQQLVIEAVKYKVFSTQNFLNPSRGLAVYNELKSHIDTDFDLSAPNELLKLALRYNTAQFKNLALDLNLLENPPEDERGWILIPKNNDWNLIHEYIRNQLVAGQASESAQQK